MFFGVIEEILEDENIGDACNFSVFLLNLLKLKKYDLLYKIVLSYNKTELGYHHFIDDETLQTLEDFIESKNDDLIIEYIKTYINI